jgi:hypothetical protein
MLGKDAADNILVNLDSEGVSDLLSHSHAAETWIAPLHFDDGRDELGGWSFRTGLAALRRRGKEQAVFPLHQRLVELEQRCRLDECAKFWNPAWAQEQSGHPEHAATERGHSGRGVASDY